MDELWESQIQQAERTFDLKLAINLLGEMVDQHRDRAELHLRVIFMLLDFLVDGIYSFKEGEIIAKKLRQYYNDSYKKYLNNPEYLAFTGMMITKSDWYFEKTFDDGIRMIKKAVDLVPANVTYKALYFILQDQRPEKNAELKTEILECFFSNELNVKNLEKKGLIGRYVLGLFESVYGKYETALVSGNLDRNRALND